MRLSFAPLFLLCSCVLTSVATREVDAQSTDALLRPAEVIADTTYGHVSDWFDVRSLNGDVMQFPEFQDRVLFVNFWATWCAPCVEEMPTIVDLAASLGDARISVLLISIDEDERAVRRFAKKHDVANLVYFPEWEPGTSTFKAGIVPASFIVDRQGAISYQHHGAANWNTESIRRFLLRKASG